MAERDDLQRIMTNLPGATYDEENSRCIVDSNQYN